MRTVSVGVGSMFMSVCLFVWSITQKRMIPKCSNLAYTLEYSRNDMVLGFESHRLGYSMGLNSYECLLVVMCYVDADLSDVDLDDADVTQQYDGKIGTKKLKKLEEKAARKAQREVCTSEMCFV